MAPEGVATLKRLYRERDRVRLQPANASMQPIYVMPEALRVQGKVVAVVRQLG
jgi:repressor LexA